MIEIPDDPVEILVQHVRQFGLTLMGEDLIISGGMSTPNEIVTTPLYFERLDTEDIISRRVAQYRSSLRNGQRMMTLYLVAGMRHVRRATRLASNR